MASQLLGEPVYGVNQLGPESGLATLVPVEFPLTSSSETRLRETFGVNQTGCEGDGGIRFHTD
jgi:hypothetical protein